MTKVKAFLKKWIVNNIGYKILAIVFAFVLWLVILNTTDQDMTRTISNIPVTIENESVILDGTHVYTVEMGETATVVVSGKRSVINTLTPSDFSATANFAELSLTNAVPIHIELAGEKARYANSVTINQKTMSMVINLEDVVEQTFDVQVSLRGEPKEGLVIEDADTSPAMVTLTAPESVIARVSHIAVEVDATQVQGDVQLECEPVIYGFDGRVIAQNDDVYLDYPVVTVNIMTKATKLVPLTITPVGTPEDKYTLSGISYSKSGVTLKGDAEVLEGIEALQIPGELLNIEGAKEDVKITIDLSAYLPEGVTLYKDTGSVTITATITKEKENGVTNGEEVTDPTI
ncbi:MAG: hypothetical protein J6S31_04100 [Lachnospiraceae bacterium]|nr:hypothetical protein [Lachnospiraceae bacterium]